MIGVVQTESEADDRRHRRQRDVAFAPVQTHAEHPLSAKLTVRDDTGALGGGGIAAGLRAGQSEAWNFLARCQSRQVTAFLLFGPVMQQQLRRPERIRHHDGDAGNQAAAGDLGDDGRVRLRRETQAAVVLGDDHAEEAVLFEKRPDLRWQLARLHDFPFFEHAAELLDRPGEKIFFFSRQGLCLKGKQRTPTRTPGEQLPVPPHGAGLKRYAFGVTEARQDLRDPAHQLARNPLPAQRTKAE